jgi:L-2-hydroxyglutarate oxidase
MRPPAFDFCVIGGGIVGLATAARLLDVFPGCALVLVEKEDRLAAHQTGHNSGVIHAGIYYEPGSLKARLCREGAAATKAFCDEHGIAYLQCGKSLVATNELELARLEGLVERADANGIVHQRLGHAELREREPNIVGLGALFLPATAVVDYRQVCDALAADLAAKGGTIVREARVDAIEEAADGVTVRAGDAAWTAGQLVACAGLQADRLARLAGLRVDFRIVPFRGEYYRLPRSRDDLVRSLIYPIPDPELPFLGIHLTRTVDGGVTVGPNAVLGRAREGYRKRDVDTRDVGSYLRFPGFWRMARRNLRSGAAELANSLSKHRYLAACRKYCPSLTVDDLLPEAAGIRAQAVMSDGTLQHDFLFAESARTVHVCNAPSPAATSALPIGRMISERVAAQRRTSALR